MAQQPAQQSRFVLIYDGDCAFCRYTVEYAHAVTGDAVVYRAYQQAAQDHPEIPVEDFRASIQLLTDGARHEGAEAAFRTLALGGRSGWLAWYRRMPGFAAVTEWLYTWVARHRAGCMRVSRILIGPELRPAHHTRTARLMIRGICACSLAAFVSLWWQVEALYGPDGILPAGAFLDAVATQTGAERYWYLPTLLWLGSGSVVLHILCGAGTLAALIGVAGRLPATAALVQYGCYLSLLHAGQVFLSYQWDTFLLECLIVAAVLARAPTAGIWVARLVLLRFMFLSGFVKLASGDPTWWGGSALAIHFETQPLPNVIAWYAHNLPDWFLTGATYATLAIEIVVPVLILGPARLRLAAFWLFLGLEGMIFLTGNYNFFNLLTIVLCFSLLDDARLPFAGRLSSSRLPLPAPAARASGPARLVATALITLGLAQLLYQVRLLPDLARPLLFPARSLAVANPYGLFAVMTTRRDELLIEGTLDGESWRAYGFPFKPGDPLQPPRWATPHQPRLDWQMWFATLEGPDRADWIYGLVDALLRANPAVLALLEDPFDGARPEAIRITVFRYRFTTAAERAETGAWWVRDQRRQWLPPMKLRRPIIRHQPLEL